MDDDDIEDNNDGYDDEQMEEEEDEDDDSVVENPHYNTTTKIYGKDRKTVPRLTSYEKARIIATRSMQIENGSRANIDVQHLTNSIDIAEKELQEQKTPLYVGRPLGDGNSMEIWHTSELMQIDVGLQKMKTPPFQQIGNLTLTEIFNFSQKLN